MGKPMPESKCPLCNRDAGRQPLDAGRDGTAVTCGYCGDFGIAGSLEITMGSARLDPATKDLLPSLAAYIREANQRREPVMLDTQNWILFARVHSGTSVSSKVKK